MPSVLLYRGRRVKITQDVFETILEKRVQFRIEDLSDVRIVRYEPDGRAGERVLGLSALGAAFLMIPIIGPVSRIAAVVATLVFAVGAAMELFHRRPVRWELIALCVGNPVTLFVSSDRTEFEQVCRGLQRALERRKDMC